MPSGMASDMRAFVAAMSAAERAALVLEKSPWSRTGYVNVIQVKKWFQARIQVPGDGRGGSKKRTQCALAGLFDTPEEAAINLAAYKKNCRLGRLLAAQAEQAAQAAHGCAASCAAAATAPGHGNCHGHADADDHGASASCSGLADADAAAWLRAAAFPILTIVFVCVVNSMRR